MYAKTLLFPIDKNRNDIKNTEIIRFASQGQQMCKTYVNFIIWKIRNCAQLEHFD